MYCDWLLCNLPDLLLNENHIITVCTDANCYVIFTIIQQWKDHWWWETLICCAQLLFWKKKERKWLNSFFSWRHIFVFMLQHQYSSQILVTKKSEIHCGTMLITHMKQEIKSNLGQPHLNETWLKCYSWCVSCYFKSQTHCSIRQNLNFFFFTCKHLWMVNSVDIHFFILLRRFLVCITVCARLPLLVHKVVESAW